MNDLECNYIVYGEEVGEQGTPHLQGFVTFKNSCRLAALKKLIPRAHWEKAISKEAAANYCMKEQNYVIRDHRTQGERNELLEFADQIRLSGIKRAAETHPAQIIKYPSGAKLYHRLMLSDCNWHIPPLVKWYYGEAGSGKTRSVFEQYSDIYVKNCSKGNKWFDGYHQQKVCLLDDFRSDTFDWGFLLQLLDRYPLMVEIKGEMIPFNSPIIIITTPRSPENTFVNIGEDINQLLRRISEQKNFEQSVTRLKWPKVILYLATRYV